MLCSLGTDTSSKFGLLLRLESGITISTCSIPVRTRSLLNKHTENCLWHPLSYLYWSRWSLCQWSSYSVIGRLATWWQCGGICRTESGLAVDVFIFICFEPLMRATCVLLVRSGLMIVRSLLAWAALQDSAASQFNQSWRSRSPPKTQPLMKWSPGRSLIQESRSSAVIRRNTTRQSTTAVAVQKCLADRCRAAYCQDSHKVFKPPIDVAVDVPKDLMRDWGERRLVIPTGSTIV